MIDAKIQRINELAKIAKERALTPEELEERDRLRREYITAFRGNLETTLSTVVIMDENGNKTSLKKKSPKEGQDTK